MVGIDWYRQFIKARRDSVIIEIERLKGQNLADELLVYPAELINQAIADRSKYIADLEKQRDQLDLLLH